jgi:hypothetical protein
MIAFLFTFGLAALLVVGGMRGRLPLRPHRRVSTGRRLSGLRRVYTAPMNYTTGEDASSHYTRKAVVTLILLLFILNVIIIIAISAVIH